MHRQKMQIDKKKATRSLPVENCIAEVQKKKKIKCKMCCLMLCVQII